MMIPFFAEEPRRRTNPAADALRWPNEGSPAWTPLVAAILSGRRLVDDDDAAAAVVVVVGA